MNQTINHSNNHQEKPKGITKIAVSGYKSLYEECTIEVRPLTILAGANSSGKSSIMQPLLLMKQTLEATYDPGALLLNGPNVKFTSAKQIFSKFGQHSDEVFSIFIEIENKQSINTTFIKPTRQDIEIVEMVHREVDKEFVMHPGIVPSPMISIIQDLYKDFYDFTQKIELSDKQIVWLVDRNRCFLDVVALMADFDLGIRQLIPKYDEMLDVVVHCLPAGSHRILDLGCGTGELSLKILNYFPDVEIIALDYSYRMIKFAQEKITAAGYGNRWTGIEADFGEWAINPKKINISTGFDAAVSSLA